MVPTLLADTVAAVGVDAVPSSSGGDRSVGRYLSPGGKIICKGNDADALGVLVEVV